MKCFLIFLLVVLGMVAKAVSPPYSAFDTNMFLVEPQIAYIGINTNLFNGGSQTPWVGPINGAGYSLTNASLTNLIDVVTTNFLVLGSGYAGGYLIASNSFYSPPNAAGLGEPGVWLGAHGFTGEDTFYSDSTYGALVFGEQGKGGRFENEAGTGGTQWYDNLGWLFPGPMTNSSMAASSLMYTDPNGKFSSATVGSGLSFAGGTLSATGSGFNQNNTGGLTNTTSQVWSNAGPTTLAALYVNGQTTNEGPIVGLGNSNYLSGSLLVGGNQTNALAQTNLVSVGAPAGYFSSGSFSGNGGGLTNLPFFQTVSGSGFTFSTSPNANGSSNLNLTVAGSYTAGTNGQVLSYNATAATYEPTNVAFHTFVSSVAINTYYTNLSGGEEIVRLSVDGVSTGSAVGEVGLNAYVDRVFQQTWGFTDTTSLGFTTFGSVTIFV